MTCEVCGEDTNQTTNEAGEPVHSDVPQDEEYFAWIVKDADQPGLPMQKFHFCSADHMMVFLPPEEIKA